MSTEDKIGYDPPPWEPEGYINLQWKNTQPCMDVICRCGRMLHVDDELFADWLTCKHCGAGIQIAHSVAMRFFDRPDAPEWRGWDHIVTASDCEPLRTPRFAPPRDSTPPSP